MATAQKSPAKTTGWIKHVPLRLMLCRSLYLGFGWMNLKGKDADQATIPRRGGEFFWEQFVTASKLGIDMAYVAMFDEATAIFKVSSTPPTQARSQAFEDLPSDWYL